MNAGILQSSIENRSGGKAIIEYDILKNWSLVILVVVEINPSP